MTSNSFGQQRLRASHVCITALVEPSKLRRSSNLVSRAPPGQGKPATQSRNQRRKQAQQCQKLKEKGILPGNTTVAEFKELPPAPKLDAPTEILGMLNRFSRDLSDIIYGRGDDKSMVQNNHTTYESFKSDIWATALNFKPFEKKVTETASKAKSKRARPENEESEDSEDEDSEDSDSEDSDSNADTSVPDEPVKSVVKPCYLSDIRQIIKRSKSKVMCL